ncbi:MAG: tetratricopeptide repeat protein [Candidatus Obscuribacterales bacterium]|nr:tetratricopeptide repeat protein [Candidatus Obscuribacterales bacterium]
MNKVLQLVKDLVSQDRWDEAHSVLARHARQTRNDPDVEYYLGVLCFNMGRFDEAERHLKTCLSITPKNADAHYQLGLCLLKERRPQEAMPEFRESCEGKDGFAVGHLHWGLALAEMGKLPGALGQFKQAIKCNPKLASAHYQAGICAFQLEQYGEASEHFKQACNADPKLAEAFNGLGISLCAMGNISDGASCFQKAVEIDSQYALAHRNWAQALVQIGKQEEAVKHYQDAINLAPQSMTAAERALIYNDWGVNLFQQNMLDEACEKFLQAVDVDAALEHARLNLGLVYMALKEYDRAAEVFEKGLDINYANVDMAMYCSVNYLLTGRFDDALGRLNKVVASGIQHSDIDLWMGFAHVGSGRTEPAEKCFERALGQNPRSFLALDGWGCAHALAGNHQAAVEKFRACVQINDGYGLGHLHLARSLDELGQPDVSKHEFREAILRDPLCIIPQKEALDKLLDAHQFEFVMQQSMKLLDVLPHDVDAKLALAKALRAQNRLNEALHLVQELIVERPNNGPARVIAGQIFLVKGRYLEADEMFRDASELYEGEANLYYCWGKTLALLGLHDFALEKYQRASEIDPYDGDVYEAWGATLKALGRFAEAAEVYKRASQYI